MHWVRFAALILVASILQAGPVGIVAVKGVRPDLLLILLVFFASRIHSTEAVIASFATGFLADLISPTMGLMGPRIISYGVFGTLLSDLQGVIALRRPIHFMAASLIALLTLLRAGAATAHLGAELFWQPLYSALLGPLVAMPAGWLMGLGTGRRRAGGRWPR
jgi:rod shape-determining protein MreD